MSQIGEFIEVVHVSLEVTAPLDSPAPTRRAWCLREPRMLSPDDPAFIGLSRIDLEPIMGARVTPAVSHGAHCVRHHS